MRHAARVFSTAACLAGLATVAIPFAHASDPASRLQLAQLSGPDLVLRIDRLEEEIRRLTGLVEQLQYRNQQLEQQLRRAQGATGTAPQADAQPRGREPDTRATIPGGATVPGGAMPTAPVTGEPPSALPAPAPPAATAAEVPSGRRDVFDPSQNPTAPGVPRTLGTLSEAAGPPVAGRPANEPPGIGAPGGRAAGAPLDLSSLSGQAAREVPQASGAPLPSAAIGPAGGPQPPGVRSPPGNGVQTVMAPSATPRDEYDLAYGYVLHKDYALAEDSFRVFLKKYPGDRLVPDANYWLGETLFQRQRYRDAAESFLTVSTKYETAARAPDALLRLGQSLAALGEKDAACATLNEVGRRYPRASVALKQGVEREHKRAGC
jgi:tol-pal system protein YbgF